MKIRAAVLRHMGLPYPYKDSRPLKIEEIELAPPGRDEVLVRIRAAGLCHSDLSVINGDRPRPLPMALGHEAAGEVVQVGGGVTDLQPGDHVALVFVPSCGHCGPCCEGRPALCEPGALANGNGTLLSGSRLLSSLGGEPINHHVGCSAFAEYAVVSRRSLVRLDPTVSFEHAALFGCAVLTGVGAVVNTAQVRAGQSVAVVGLGGVGLAAVIGAIAAGAREVVAIDLSAEKRELALKLGATQAFDGGDPACVEAVRKATEGGLDHVFEFAGSVRAFDTAYRVTRRGGTTITGGLPPPDATFPLPMVNLVAEERTVKGSYIGTCVPSRDLPRYVRLFQHGWLPINQLLSHRLRLEDINEGFDRLHSGEAVRQVIIFD
ncbi:zinc-dependent alcohol dehydrogenase family protein [Herbaspirillum sp. RTI4]|uniref:zinc-dependent alcohol dehydrogenase family protein n=1 Tax=Herbaspirillum sp. RTI4 TaxID=3048640 RepID=UPI002AB40941|nr:zinc-dependent alcohol dehydrogenase family protein [Herbaspirillum sp. RTI4]MDY7577173.1 zinc-dependent alcohol dehydrogenase family protein [Herbaspirillum sp. RTI4]MEA9980463.1 zinc-dependent alcohol dehydrogenase family protein [Herbaspirillum sp. RTI4]